MRGRKPKNMHKLLRKNGWQLCVLLLIGGKVLPVLLELFSPQKMPFQRRKHKHLATVRNLPMLVNNVFLRSRKQQKQRRGCAS